MELALYAPGLGYYTAGAGKFGGVGDFVTAPEISSHFGGMLARQAEQILAETRGDILELGAGSGRLALDILQELGRQACLPSRYCILEVSPDLRERQHRLFTQEGPEFLERLIWLEQLPEQFNGLILANEVLDALPVHMLHWRDGGLEERGVGLSEAGFVWEDQPLLDGALRKTAVLLPDQEEGYVSEINLAGPALIRALAESMEHGVMLFLDYGFPRAEYYHPQRKGGTMMCHYRHYAHDDPFFLPGLQDITAHVDFTAMADAALDEGLAVLGYLNQATFLLNAGLLEGLGNLDPSTHEYIRAMSGIQKLIQPSEMGELFKVIGFGKGIELPLLGFSRGDRRHTL